MHTCACSLEDDGEMHHDPHWDAFHHWCAMMKIYNFSHWPQRPKMHMLVAVAVATVLIVPSKWHMYNCS